jgi:type II secretory pathway pseudopilin PulG
MKRKGLSLLEILIAAGIMIAAMVPLWGLMGSSHRQVVISADEVRASQIANEVLEQIENSQWLPEEGQVNFTPVRGGAIKIGGSNGINISFGDYPEYLDLQGVLEIEKYPVVSDSPGRILRLKMIYKAKEKMGSVNKQYMISTFIARK